MKFDSILEWGIGASVATCCAFVAYFVYALWIDSRSPTFELKKRDWVCTSTAERDYLHPIFNGKVTVLVPMIETVCVEYTRNK